MLHELYQLYLKCFPDYPVREPLFLSQLAPEKAHILIERQDGKLIGFSMIHDQSIALLCVDEDHRGRGVGTRLLEQSEAWIFTKADRVILGRGRYYLLQGVPDDKNSAVGFFQGRGFSAGWTSVNMCLPLADFHVDRLQIPPCPQDISFRFISEGEYPRLLEAVSDAQADWLDIFKDCCDPVLIAESGGEILGFEILSPNGGLFGLDKTASIGCVGVVHKARDRGVGRQMVAKGAAWLKRRGCQWVELRYVYLVDWYKKLGFEVLRHQWMGEKSRPAAWKQPKE